MSLWATGMPWRRPRVLPAMIAASAALASARARSAVRRMKALIVPSWRATRARQASVSSTGESLRAAMRAAASAMLGIASMAASARRLRRRGRKDQGRLERRRARPLAPHLRPHRLEMGVERIDLVRLLGREREAGLARQRCEGLSGDAGLPHDSLLHSRGLSR